MFERLFFFTDAFYQFAKGLLICFIVVALVLAYGATITWVVGDSMSPTLVTGNAVFIDKVSYRLNAPLRGDIVQLKFPGDPERTRYIKRIVGLPGETVAVRNNQILINNKVLPEAYIPIGMTMGADKQWTLGPTDYFMLGDNRPRSNDSRQFGVVERRFIIGLARYVLWPPEEYSILR